MQMILNGAPREIPGPDTQQGVIDALVQDSGRVIAELNGMIVKRGDWPTVLVQNGDSLELVSFVGGG